VIDQAVLMPSVMRLPQGASPRLFLKLQGPADAFRWRLYTRALTLVSEERRMQALLPGWGQATLALPPDLAVGTYFLQLNVQRGSVESQAKLVKLFVLR
jgi:hypothetical protein